MRSLYAYRFETNWKIEADIRQAWSLISGGDYGSWWPGVSSMLIHMSSSLSGVGNRYRFVFHTRLPYKLEFDAELMAAREPEYIRIRATGDLEGFGVWTLKQEGSVAHVRYVWRVNANKRWMNALAPLIRPAFVWNHDQVMREGAKGLSNALGAPLVSCKSKAG
jgi:Polyketide cyclase / dehydrase and lipid transport.